MSNIKNKTVKEKVQSPDHYRKIILSNIKHDLTNPINAILGYSEFINEIIKDENNNALYRDIHTIHDSGIAILAHINKIFSSDPDGSNDHIGDIIHNSKLQFSLRTPLSTIIGLTEMAMRELEFDVSNLSDTNLRDVQESIEKIAQSGKRLLQLLNDLKGYSDYTVDELMEKYKPDIYSKEASHRLFDFNADTKPHEEIGTILVVDDEPSNLDLLEKILQQSNHTVFTAVNAKIAIDILSDKSSDIDLILLDLIMPGMNGMELLQKLKLDSHTFQIPVIMTSGL